MFSNNLSIIREELESEEEIRLSPLAARSRSSRGRDRNEEPSPVRTEYQRDRDRIIHSKVFRRLKHKTQVFIAPVGDHFVTRLTHTLEVAQIARTISRALRLNEDLTEAIALGHDLGHTPFGHVGEDVLNELFSKGFHHNEQSLRVVRFLERNGTGLNLTWEVQDGILNHSKSRDSLMAPGGTGSTLEAQVCKLADSVAYINHDTGDAIRAGMITENDLPHAALTRLGKTTSERINTMVCDIIDFSWNVRTGEPQTGPAGKPLISMSSPILDAADNLREFLFKQIYERCSNNTEAQKAKYTIRRLYEYFLTNPGAVPDNNLKKSETIERQIVDYIAGMTDQFILGLAATYGIQP
ncbi:MAG: deoxyguanosinetriphosphate triphosphohydrolase [Dehalococcoidia bacterium]|nr:deoxyguanosinetriphosphate triphosphohydrolase [Dehalococcoidia bacterium]MDZ4246842.1 deoxyguanosinetriphosphate triphosphohydrolase [Dehalococcoidia bacterium]